MQAPRNPLAVDLDAPSDAPRRRIGVPQFKSLGSKLLLLVSVCLLLTVAIISFRNASQFLHVLEDRQNETARQQARDAATNAGNVLDNWGAQTALVVHQAFSSGDGSKTTLAAQLKGLVYSGRELVAAVVYDGGKAVARVHAEPAADEVRFEDKDPRVFFKQLDTYTDRWLKTEAAKATKAGRSVVVVLPEKKLGLPVLNLCQRFVKPEGGEVWTVLTVWTTRLVAALPQGGTTASALLRSDGRVVATRADDAQVAALGAVTGGFAKALARGTTLDGASLYELDGGEQRIGAWAQLKRFGLAVLVAADARLATSDVKGVVVDTAAWTWVILLGAIMISALAVSATTKRLKEATAVTERIAAGDFGVELAPKGGDEVAVLSRAVGRMARQIRELLLAKVEAARQEKELETARIVQETLFPKGDVEAPGLRVAGRTRIASECGGDWWGHFQTDDGLHFVIIADATGHGAPAALVTALAHAACMTTAERLRSPEVHGGSVVGLLESMNRTLWNTGHGRTTMTALAILFDPRTGETACASAGHCMPYLVSTPPGVPGEPAPAPTFKVVKARGAPLGFEEAPGFKESKLTLGPGDKLLMYTDGLTDCTSAEGERWGKKALERAVGTCATKAAGGFGDGVLGAALAHFGSKPVEDDVTIVVVERPPESAHKAPAAPLRIGPSAA